MKVLVICEHAIHRYALSLMLHEEFPHAEIAGAAHPRDALNKPGLDRFGLIFFDLTAATPHDAAPVKAFTEAAPGVPLLVLSGSDDVEHMQAALRAGAAAYVHQAQGPKALRHILHLVLSGERYYPVGVAFEAQKAPPDPPDRPAVTAAAAETELTGRQIKVLGLLAEGLSNKEIARRMDILEGTVKSHVRAIMSRLGARNRTQVAVEAARRGLTILPGAVEPPPDRLPPDRPAAINGARSGADAAARRENAIPADR